MKMTSLEYVQEDLKKDFKKRLIELREIQKEERSVIEERYESEVEKAQNEFKEKVSKIENLKEISFRYLSHYLKIRKLRKEWRDLQEQVEGMHSERFLQFKENITLKINKIKADLKEKLKRKERASLVETIEDLRERHKKRRDKLKRNHLKEIEKLKEKSKRKIEERIEEYKKREEERGEEVKRNIAKLNELKGNITELKEELEKNNTLTKEKEEKVNTLKNALIEERVKRQKIDSIKAQREEQIKSLKNALKETEEEYKTRLEYLKSNIEEQRKNSEDLKMRMQDKIKQLAIESKRIKETSKDDKAKGEALQKLKAKYERKIKQLAQAKKESEQERIKTEKELFELQEIKQKKTRDLERNMQSQLTTLKKKIQMLEARNKNLTERDKNTPKPFLDGDSFIFYAIDVNNLWISFKKKFKEEVFKKRKNPLEELQKTFLKKKPFFVYLFATKNLEKQLDTFPNDKYHKKYIEDLIKDRSDWQYVDIDTALATETGSLLDRYHNQIEQFYLGSGDKDFHLLIRKAQKYRIPSHLIVVDYANLSNDMIEIVERNNIHILY
jgi:myosin heavy subunit